MQKTSKFEAGKELVILVKFLKDPRAIKKVSGVKTVG